MLYIESIHNEVGKLRDTLNTFIEYQSKANRIIIKKLNEIADKQNKSDDELKKAIVRNGKYS